MKKSIICISLSIVLLLIFSLGLWADERVYDWPEDLAKIALNRVPGQIVKVEKDFEKDTNSWEYEFTIHTSKGQCYEVTVDSKLKKVVDVDGPEECHADHCHGKHCY